MIQTDYVNDIADIHEDVLMYFLDYRERNDSELGLLLRNPKREREALQKGWWFKGNDHYANIFFSESFEGPHYRNNFQIAINKQGTWSLQLDFERTDVNYGNANIPHFLDFIAGSFSSLGKLEYRVRMRKYVLEPDFPFYRNGLPEIMNVIEKLFRQDQFLKQKWIKPVSEKDFLSRLEGIQDLRKRKPQISLSGIKLENFYGFKNSEVNSLPKAAPWIFLTGENGHGKTLLLQAIAIGFYGDIEGKLILKNKETRISIQYLQESEIRSNLQVNDIQYYDFFRPVSKIACYGPSRLSLQSQQSKNEEAKNATATYSLFNQDGVLKNIEYELFASYYDRPEKFRTIENLLKKVIPSLHKIDLNTESRQILYYEKEGEKNGQTFEPVAFDQLASGIRSIIAMVGDIYLRLSERNSKEAKKPNQKDSQSEESNYSAENLSGIVIIDELDLHLHPDWQYELPGLLSKVFPNIQFIASTHSPIPLLGAPQDSIFITVLRTKEEGIMIKKLDVDIRDLTPNLILSSEIFGFHNVIAKSNEDRKQVRTEDTVDEKEFRDELKRRLMKFAEEEGDYPENLFKK